MILDGCFSEHMARLLVDEAGVQAVIGTRRKVLPANAQTFAAQFYAALAEGATIRRAYRGALAALKQQENGQADRFELIEADALDALDDPAVPLPPAEARAGCPLVVSGDPLLINLPQRAGFIGRRVMLSALAQDPPGEDPRVIAFEGGVGLGKTWLAAEVAGGSRGAIRAACCGSRSRRARWRARSRGRSRSWPGCRRTARRRP